MALPRSMLKGTDAERATYLAALRAAPIVDVEITQTMKQADMPLIPHAFTHAMDGIAAVALLDTRRLDSLCDLHCIGESVCNLLHQDYVRLDNTPLQSPAPPGVQMLRPRWRNTGA